MDDTDLEDMARDALDAAIDDEIRHAGAAVCSETLCCFIEHRIAAALKLARNIDTGALLRLPHVPRKHVRLN